MNNKELEKNLEKERKKQREDAIMRMYNFCISSNHPVQAKEKFTQDLDFLAKLADEHFEEKAETNYEHYKDEIIEECYFTVALVDGKPHKCSSVKCNDCGFSTGHGCEGKIKEWLNKLYEKPTYKLSQFEYDLINAYDRCKECCLLNEIEALKRMSEKGYFKGIDPFTKVHEILDNCEVIQ